ncbi:hypothetical protein OG2516_11946 [Oceanicola granulosus HTCC2516]|uniref:Lipoprotein n=1 Tax=Oceanicola granulosus (strain ATCC BAA-861 / DSM 15982 / KCTC 12143 / HTCC2516) TaxID=314256 RepID=Q2CBD5_OCEGH|nr:YjbF family lipoprotein [Oceanicola granulosus]EAR49963.1 hypothetical protein OG2516_11946 [Oceanicola granulosus HTCC2516]
MNGIHLALLGGALAALAACGPRYEGSSEIVTGVGQGLLARFGLDGGSSSTAPAAEATAAPALDMTALAADGREFILASIPSRDTFALIQPAGQNGPERTWLSEDGISVTFESGMLVATRGLGPDLMAADVSGTVAAMRQGGGAATRVHEYLDGNDQIVRFDYSCRVDVAGTEEIAIYDRTYASVKFTESCERGSQAFTNSYWLDETGVVRKSRQLISPPVGYLDTNRL